MLQTLRSHDQFNTTIYGLNDRYRGIVGGRRVVFVNADDLADAGLRQRPSRWTWSATGPTTTCERTAERLPDRRLRHPARLRGGVLPGDQPLVPLDSTAEGSNTPTSKSVIISLVPARHRRCGTERQRSDTMDATGADEGHKSRPEPHAPVVSR